MYCANCGTQNEDNVMFCRNCGTPLQKQGGGQGAPHMNPGAAQGGQRMNAGPAVYRSNPVSSDSSLTGALRALIQSPLYMVAVIAFTAQIAIAVIAAATGYNPYAQMIYTIINNTGMYSSDYYYQLMPALNAMSRTNALSTILSNAVPIMIAVGLWLEFASARNESQPMSTTGFTMIRILMIIQMVSLAIVFIVALVGTMIALTAVSRYSDESPVAGIIIVLVIFAIAGFLIFFYYIKVIGMLASARNVFTLGRKTSQASLYVIVLTFITGGLQCFSALGSLFTAGIMGFLSTAAAATATICFGMLMLKFNSLETMQGAAGAGRKMPNRPVNRAPGYAPSNEAPAVNAPAASPIAQPAANPNQPVASNVPPFIPPKPGTVVMGYSEDSIRKIQYANEGTVVLNEEPSVPPAKLVSANGQVEMHIAKPEFTIGKGYGSVDGFIDNNPAISRKHAKIVYNNGKFYVIDTKSTNHVYVEGKQIPVETPVEIRDGMRIRFADELYVFSEKA